MTFFLKKLLISSWTGITFFNQANHQVKASGYFFSNLFSFGPKSEKSNKINIKKALEKSNLKKYEYNNETLKKITSINNITDINKMQILKTKFGIYASNSIGLYYKDDEEKEFSLVLATKTTSISSLTFAADNNVYVAIEKYIYKIYFTEIIKKYEMEVDIKYLTKSANNQIFASGIAPDIYRLDYNTDEFEKIATITPKLPVITKANQLKIINLISVNDSIIISTNQGLY